MFDFLNLITANSTVTGTPLLVAGFIRLALGIFAVFMLGNILHAYFLGRLHGGNSEKMVEAGEAMRGGLIGTGIVFAVGIITPQAVQVTFAVLSQYQPTSFF
ncbi:hypothetical protein A3C96_03680 [Candidatus Uhrbacteria bacterium RIFCSPHIGHO2_02_FULL_60_10]|uniref:Uncharacterized protein n=1 Tax=Candidatus Uhrbacteria bacterium RIFCSPHIGHO2_02_FULL_60_10 TaxID=1802392 RepID=A0A1F7U373_9BACT|nr:MAG: hypothetical protein A3C96_03680 [Candidatus Uhrbacteria bacterium RIFCSPHIGHO2_02_FULL_60_10]